MKKVLLALFGVLLMVTSCSKESDVDPVENGKDVPLTLAVTAPDAMAMAKSTTKDATNSAKGGYTNVDKTTHDVRFILEVKTQDGSRTIKRLVNTTDNSNTSFSLTLTSGVTYKFVFWADFVAEGSQEDLHYNTADLSNITIKADGINDECRDAYTMVKDILVKGGDQAEPITLTRPFAKLRVITKDMDKLTEGYTNVDKVKVSYQTAVPSVYDAVTGKYTTETIKRTFDATAITAYAEGYDTLSTHKTLFVDYFLADKNQQKPVQFEMVTYDGTREIRTHKFTTDIPVRGNYLTTVTGNFLTTGIITDVEIDDEFGGEINGDGENFTVKHLVKVGANSYKAMTVDALKEFRDLVNTGVTFGGKTVYLGADLDLKNEAWIPIGSGVAVGSNVSTPSDAMMVEGAAAASAKFMGTFDGQGFTISNLTVKVTGNSPAGLFGDTSGATIKNVTVKNVNISGNYRAAGIVAHGLCLRMENCHVDGGSISSTPWKASGDKYDDANQVGGLVGYLTAQNTAWAKDGSAKNLTIKAYRDVAGIAGMAQYGAVVTGNTVENVKVSAIRLVQYVEEKEANVGVVVGRISGSPVIEDNVEAASEATVVAPDVNGKVVLPEGTSVEYLAKLVDGVKEIVFTGDVKGTPKASNPYSSRPNGINLPVGATLDGNGNELAPEGAYWTVLTYGGTIKNVDITTGERGLVIYNIQEDVVIENSTLGGPNVGYGLNSGELDRAAAGAKLIVNNSTLVGWISFNVGKNADNVAEFTDCKFEEGKYWQNYGYTADYDRFMRAYSPATFTNCEFAEGFVIEAIANVKFVNCTYAGVPVTSSNVSVLVDPDSKGTVTVESDATEAVVSSGTMDSFDVAMNSGLDIKLAADVKGASAKSNGYGKTGVNHSNYKTIDGGGNKITITGANATWDSNLATKGGIIKNVEIDGGFRGIFVTNGTQKVILENVVVKKSVYTISCDQAGKQGLEATGCTFDGWTSFAATLGDAKFVDCSFGEGSGYKFMRPYAPTVLENCTFCEGYQIDPRATTTLKNCKVGGVLVTDANKKELLGSENLVISNN